MNGFFLVKNSEKFGQVGPSVELIMADHRAELRERSLTELIAILDTQNPNLM